MSELYAKLPTDLYLAAQVRELDRIAIEEEGIPGITLMERAGQAAFAVLRAYWPEAARIAVVCGGGNNAGDGYVLARLAAEAGLHCDVMALSDPVGLQGDAGLALDRFLATDKAPQAFAAGIFSRTLNQADVIVDALLGTGLDRGIEGEYRQAIRAINAGDAPVLSIDAPSGINADSGRCMGAAIKAAATLTFIGLKQGLFSADGPEHSGRILFSDLGVPPSIYAKINPVAERLGALDTADLLPPRPRNSHKGDFGHVVAIGGDYGFAGSICMAAEAAGRVGAGLTSVATRPQHAFAISSVRPELMALGVNRAADLRPLLDKATVVVIGPGLGTSAWGQALLSRVLETELPLVVDADALNLLAQEPAHSDRWIITPHPGEAARLLGSSTTAIQQDRFGAAQVLQQKYGGVVVVKGSGTLIAAARGLSVCTAGNPGMASGGMGDVLAGVLAGLLAQGLGIHAAARLGVNLHAHAADAAAREGERGMLASDLMPFLRELVNA